jgi:hypothetical protein
MALPHAASPVGWEQDAKALEPFLLAAAEGSVLAETLTGCPLAAIERSPTRLPRPPCPAMRACSPWRPLPPRPAMRPRPRPRPRPLLLASIETTQNLPGPVLTCTQEHGRRTGAERS